VYALKEEIRGDHGLFTEVIDHGCIIAHANNGGCLLEFNVFCEVFDQSEFANLTDLCSFLTHS
jgi:hypothetical protein